MLSLSPPEYLYNKELDDDELSFLVEARSWGGFSGSPVLAYRSPNQVNLREEADADDREFILGVLWGHLTSREVVVTRAGSPTGDPCGYEYRSSNGGALMESTGTAGSPAVTARRGPDLKHTGTN